MVRFALLLSVFRYLTPWTGWASISSTLLISDQGGPGLSPSYVHVSMNNIWVVYDLSYHISRLRWYSLSPVFSTFLARWFLAWFSTTMALVRALWFRLQLLLVGLFCFQSPITIVFRCSCRPCASLRSGGPELKAQLFTCPTYFQHGKPLPLLLLRDLFSYPLSSSSCLTSYGFDCNTHTASCLWGTAPSADSMPSSPSYFGPTSLIAMRKSL